MARNHLFVCISVFLVYVCVHIHVGTCVCKYRRWKPTLGVFPSHSLVCFFNVNYFFLRISYMYATCLDYILIPSGSIPQRHVLFIYSFIHSLLHSFIYCSPLSLFVLPICSWVWGHPLKRVHFSFGDRVSYWTQSVLTGQTGWPTCSRDQSVSFSPLLELWAWVLCLLF